MNAPDFATCYNLAGAFEPALQTLLSAIEVDGVAIFAAKQRDTSDLPSEHVGVQFTQGAWTGSFALSNDAPPRMLRRAWNYTLSLNLATNAVPTDPARHGRIRGLISALMNNPATFGPAVTPYHVLSTIQEQATNEGVNVKNDQAVSRMLFTGIACVRNSAWPVIGTPP